MHMGFRIVWRFLGTSKYFGGSGGLRKGFRGFGGFGAEGFIGLRWTRYVVRTFDLQMLSFRRD